MRTEAGGGGDNWEQKRGTTQGADAKPLAEGSTVSMGTTGRATVPFLLPAEEF